MALRLNMLVALHLGHNVRTLQAQIRRAQRDDAGFQRLGYDARLLEDFLHDAPVVLECLLTRILDHGAHVLWDLSAMV